MTIATSVAPPTAAPRRPALDRRLAMRLAAEEYDAFTAQLRTLEPQDWDARTPCPEWDVHAMVCHVLGSAEMSARVAEQIRQVRGARKAGGLFIDALTSLQVRKHVQLSPAELVEAMAAVGPKAATGRRRTPSLVRRIPMKDMPVDETGARTEAWQLGFLVDVVLTRDTWMHRSDIGAAVGRPMVLRPDHDGAIVADVVAEWAARHGQPCSLTLTGPAGGTWELNGARAAGGSAAYELDAVEFCRILSGRGSGEGLLATRVPF